LAPCRPYRRRPGAEITNRRYRWLLRVRRERPRRRTERA
jgi:hypothetical protein